MNAPSNKGWPDRLGRSARMSWIVVTSILLLFAVAMLAGFTSAFIEKPHLPTKPLAFVALAVIVGLVVLFGWLLARLIRSIRPETMSGFDRRYWKMWTVIGVLSLLLGIGLGAFGQGESGNGITGFLSNDPISPLTAIVTAIVLVTTLSIAGIYYHRTVDDHEERAYLWGSTFAYYFLMLAFPLHWLLARGGLVPTLSFGVALSIILLSCVVQAIGWALFKFR